jgi:diphthamide synthase (EF-2-diphthine--ammonia ligase)
MRSHLIARIRITHLISEHEDVVMLHEVSVDIFQRSACCLGIEQVDEWYESTVENGPDDVELPTERADTDWGDFDHDEVA